MTKSEVQGLEKLAEMEYPGRFFILAQDPTGKDGVVVFGITGRKESTQARRLTYDEKRDVVFAEITDPEVLSEGVAALMNYPAIFRAKNFTAVSNGAQTSLLYKKVRNMIRGIDPVIALTDAFQNQQFCYDPKLGWIDLTSYEPDAPDFTSRINGLIWDAGKKAASSIIRKSPRSTSRSHPKSSYWLKDGKGGLVTTYDGTNRKIMLPSSGIEEVRFTGETPEDIAKEVYESLAPKEGKADLRVAVACMFTREKEPYIINRH